MGRPNVGKSSLVNRLLGEERLVVSDESGTTRDAIDTPMSYHGRSFVFVDTAGLRRQTKIEDGIEFYSSLRARRAIERSDICVLVIDAVEGLHNQDLKIATLAWDAGRGLIVVVNKWDLAEKDDKATARFEKSCREKAPYLKFVPFLFTSALTGQRVQRLLELLLHGGGGAREAYQHVAGKCGAAGTAGAAAAPAGGGSRGAVSTTRRRSRWRRRRSPCSAITRISWRNTTCGICTTVSANAWGFTGNPLRIVLRRKAS